MPQTIPLPPALPNFDLQADLDGTTYTLAMRWNARLGAWFVRVLDATGVVVLMGDQRLVADFPVALYVTGRQPPGLLTAVDTSGAGLNPGFDDLGSRVILTYTTAAELA